jgi:hypothetical protein
MTTINEALVTSVNRALSATNAIAFNVQMMDLLTTKASLLELGGETTVDIQRLPADVNNLTTFCNYIMAIKDEINKYNEAGNKIDRNKKGEIEGDVPKYMLNGRLKLLKTTMCIFMAIRKYQDSHAGQMPTGTVSAITEELLTYAAGNVPNTLSNGAVNLWKNVFGDGKNRTRNLLALIISWCGTA